MSTDIYFSAHDTPPPPRLPTGREPQGRAMGSLRDMRAALSAIAPDIDWSDPGWGILADGDDTPGISFNIGDTEPCTGFALHISGAHDRADAIVRAIRQMHPTWYAMHATAGEWMHHF